MSETKKLGSLLILDVTPSILQGVQGQYSSVDMAGQGAGPGDTYQLRRELMKSGVKVGSQIANKEVYLASNKKKYETIILNGQLLTVRNKKEFISALKRAGGSVWAPEKELEGFSKSGEAIKIGKKNFNIFK